MANAINSIPPLVEALQKKRGKSKSAQSLDHTKGTPQWYERLVRYYLDRRGQHDTFWTQVEKKYRSKRYESMADADVLDRVEPGRVYGTVHKTESIVLNRRPKFHLKGFTSTVTETQIPGLERGLNNEWNEDMRLNREMKLCARDCTKFGWGIALTTYEADFDAEQQRADAAERRETQAQDPLFATVVAEVNAEVARTAAQDSPPEDVETFEQDSRVLRESISTRRVSPWHFLIDPDATCIEDAKWVGRIIIADLDAVKADPLLSNTEKLMPTDVHSLGFMIDADQRAKYGSPGDKTTPYELVTLYEIFERAPSGGWRMVVLARGHDDFLRIEEDLYWVGCPYSILRWNDDGEEIFAQSDFLPIWTQIVAEESLMTKAFDGYARDAEDKTFVDREAITEESLWASDQPDSGLKILVEVPQGKGLRDVIMPEQSKSKSWPDFMNFMGVIRTQIELGSGQGPNQTGQALKSGSSASEVVEIANSSKAAVSHKQAAMEDFVATIAHKRLGLMAQFYDAEKVTRVAGEDAGSAWAGINWTPGDVQQGLRIIVHQGSMRPINDDAEFQKVMQTFAAVNSDPILRANTNIPALQKKLFEALWGADSESLVMETDPQKVSEASALMAAQQAGGGSPPAPRGAPSQTGAGR